MEQVAGKVSMCIPAAQWRLLETHVVRGDRDRHCLGGCSKGAGRGERASEGQCDSRCGAKSSGRSGRSNHRGKGSWEAGWHHKEREGWAEKEVLNQEARGLRSAGACGGSLGKYKAEGALSVCVCGRECCNARRGQVRAIRGRCETVQAKVLRNVRATSARTHARLAAKAPRPQRNATACHSSPTAHPSLSRPFARPFTRRHMQTQTHCYCVRCIVKHFVIAGAPDGPDVAPNR